MLNEAPIFLNSFERSGTNLLIHLLASHPGVARLRGETNEVFHGKHTEPFKKWLARLRYLPIVLSTGQKVFSARCLEPRRRFSPWLERYTDWLLYRSKFAQPENRQLADGQQATAGEVSKARLLGKNLNGVVLATDIFTKMYPAATFFGLTRNGFALCEGFLRRGWSAERFADLYTVVGEKMLADAERLPRYHLVRFEDLLADPLEFLNKLFELAELNIEEVPKFRLGAKLSTAADGSRRLTFGQKLGERGWFLPCDLAEVLRADVNHNQERSLGDREREILLARASHVLRGFGYLAEDAH